MAELGLGPTSITKNNVEKGFRDFLKDDKITLIKADAETIAAGQGFTSYILRLKFEWSDEDTKKHGVKLPKSAILKALSKDAMEKMFAHFKIDDESAFKADFTKMWANGHRTECYIYDLFGKSTPPVPIPTAYATWPGDDVQHPPMILLEDLGSTARVLDSAGSATLNLEQMLQIADAQAALHAWCWTTDQKWGEKLETMADRMAIFASFVPMMQQAMKKAEEAFPELFENLDEEKMAVLLEPETAIKFHGNHSEYVSDILVHGDFWANNLMFNKLADGSMGNDLVALIDWQFSFQGHPMSDFGRIFSMSCDGDLRTDHFDRIIKRYYDTLTEKLGDRMPKEYTFDRVLRMAHEQTALNCLMLFFMQDTLQAMFAPADNPEAETKRERMLKMAKQGFDYAAKTLNITK